MTLDSYHRSRSEPRAKVTRWKAGGWHVHIRYDDGSWERITWRGDSEGEYESAAWAEAVREDFRRAGVPA